MTLTSFFNNWITRQTSVKSCDITVPPVHKVQNYEFWLEYTLVAAATRSTTVIKNVTSNATPVANLERVTVEFLEIFCVV